MTLVTLAALGIFHTNLVPTLWLTPEGTIMLDGQEAKARIVRPARPVQLNGIVGWDFENGRGGIHVGDPKSLQITDSMTISTWLYLRSYVNEGPGAQIFFRGDDRCGLDPYSLSIWGDNTLNFGTSDERGMGRAVGAEIPTLRWTHILANLDVETGRMEFWVDGKFVALATTSKFPFAGLDKNAAPGVGIGNVQNENGPHNQPLNGMLADFRVYRAVLRPQDLDLGNGNWVKPPTTQ
jgi:hypothetical protein